MHAGVSEPTKLGLIRVRPDTAFLSAVVVILLLGLVMVASASVAVAARSTGEPLYFFYRQAVYAIIGIAAGFVVLHIPTRLWRDNGFALLTLALLLLIAVLIPGLGHSVNGARRWIGLGPLILQASEPARLLLLLYVAGYAVRQQFELRTSFAGLIRPMLPIVLASLLLLLEPNFGAMAILVAASGLILFLAGARLRYLLIAGGGALVVMAMAALSSPYRVTRLVSFTDPWQDPHTSGFQLIQSLIAIGRGHVMGVGLGNSIQKLLYLPETQTDFLFAILAEELGLIGSLVVIGLFMLVIWRGFVIAGRALSAGQLFGAFAAYGLSTWIGLQAFVNIGVNVGVLPTKGLTLPLMSYGGSSLVIMCVLLALLMRIDMESRTAGQAQPERKRRRLP